MKLFDDYAFQTDEYKKRWQSVLDNRFEYMKQHYKNKLPDVRIMILFRRAFSITPKAIKEASVSPTPREKLLAIYLVVKYSALPLLSIAEDFHVSVDTVKKIGGDKAYIQKFEEDEQKFLQDLEDDFLALQKRDYALEELAFLEKERG